MDKGLWIFCSTVRVNVYGVQRGFHESYYCLFNLILILVSGTFIRPYYKVPRKVPEPSLSGTNLNPKTLFTSTNKVGRAQFLL